MSRVAEVVTTPKGTGISPGNHSVVISRFTCSITATPSHAFAGAVAPTHGAVKSWPARSCSRSHDPDLCALASFERTGQWIGLIIMVEAAFT
jgi:hypothetical protein